VSVNRSSSYPSAPETEEHWHQRAELREKKRQAKKRQDEATAYYREHPKERPLASRLTGNRLRFPKEPPPGAEIPQPTLSDTFPPLSSTATRDQSTASDFSTSTGEQAAGMALAPKFAGQALSGSLGPNHTLELCTSQSSNPCTQSNADARQSLIMSVPSARSSLKPSTTMLHPSSRKSIPRSFKSSSANRFSLGTLHQP